MVNRFQFLFIFMLFINAWDAWVCISFGSNQPNHVFTLSPISTPVDPPIPGLSVDNNRTPIRFAVSSLSASVYRLPNTPPHHTTAGPSLRPRSEYVTRRGCARLLCGSAASQKDWWKRMSERKVAALSWVLVGLVGWLGGWVGCLLFVFFVVDVRGVRWVGHYNLG